MIDWHRPLRIKKDGRAVYVARWLWDQDAVMLDLVQNGVGMVAYQANGQPLEECPWGEIENFDPLDELSLGWRDVTTPAQRREQRETEEAMGGRPDWGMF